MSFYFKITAVLIASVFAEPESDAEAKPWLAYSNYGYAGYPYAHGVYGAGVYGAGVYGAGVYGLANGYNGYALGGHYLGKRSADSEAKPEAWYGAYGGYGAGLYNRGYGYGAGVYGYGARAYNYGYARPYAYGGYAYGK